MATPHRKYAATAPTVSKLSAPTGATAIGALAQFRFSKPLNKPSTYAQTASQRTNGITFSITTTLHTKSAFRGYNCTQKFRAVISEFEQCTRCIHANIVSMRRMCRTFARARDMKCSALPCGTVLCMQRLQYRNLPGSFFPAAQSRVVAVTFSWSLPCNSRPKPFSPHYEHASNAAFAATSIIVGTGVHDQVQAHPR